MSYFAKIYISLQLFLLYNNDFVINIGILYTSVLSRCIRLFLVPFVDSVHNLFSDGCSFCPYSPSWVDHWIYVGLKLIHLVVYNFVLFWVSSTTELSNTFLGINGYSWRSVAIGKLPIYGVSPIYTIRPPCALLT